MPRESVPVLHKLPTKCNQIVSHVHGTATWPCSPVTYWQSPQGSQSVRVFYSRMPGNPYRYIYSLTFGLLALPDHPKLSPVNAKNAGLYSREFWTPWGPASNVLPGRSDLSPWTIPGVCGDATAQQAVTLGGQRWVWCASPCCSVILTVCWCVWYGTLAMEVADLEIHLPLKF